MDIEALIEASKARKVYDDVLRVFPVLGLVLVIAAALCVQFEAWSLAVAAGGVFFLLCTYVICFVLDHVRR